MSVDGIEVVREGAELSLWRAPTDNDGPKQGWMSEVAGVRQRWIAWGLDSLESRVESLRSRRQRDGSVRFVIERTLRGHGRARIRHTQSVTIDGRGCAHFDEHVRIPRGFDDLPRVGVRMILTPDATNLEWFGRGPRESYADRHVGVPFGRWSMAVADTYEPYVVPQEHGSHFDTRWFALTSDGGPGVLVGATEPFSFSASHFPVEDLTAARNTAELEPRRDVFVHVDAAQRGLGTGACGPDALPRYRVGAGEHRWSWWIGPSPVRG